MGNFVKCNECEFCIVINNEKDLKECRKGLPTLDPQGRSAWPRVTNKDGCFEGVKKLTKRLLNE